MAEQNSRFDACCYTDEELVALSQEGNLPAKDALTRRFLSKGHAKTGAGYLDPEDLSQEGMLGFLSAVETYSPARGVPFSAYASICIRNSIRSACRKLSNEPPADEQADVTEVDARSPGPLDTIVQSESLHRTLGACDVLLSDLEKSAVYCRMSGLSYAVCAERLGVSEKSVENALGRARQKLQSVFTDE